MDEDTAVSSSLVKLLQAAQTHVARQGEMDARVNLARQAEELAGQWPRSWVAQSVVFLARSFFLFDATGAGEVFGGPQKLLEMMQAGGVEWMFLRGLGAAFRGEADAAINAFRAAEAMRPDDPFIQFSHVMALSRLFGSTDETLRMLHIFMNNHRSHPLYTLGRGLLPET
jgi:hypothetical protein